MLFKHVIARALNTIGQRLINPAIALLLMLFEGHSSFEGHPIICRSFSSSIFWDRSWKTDQSTC